MRFVLAVSLALSAALANACDCAPPPAPKKALEGSEAVFLGEAVEVEVEGQTRTVKFKVEKWWKGGDAAEMTVSTHKSGATCGFGFEKGKRYMVYAHKEEKQKLLRVSLCSRTRTQAEAEKEGDFKELGEGKVPAATYRQALAMKVALDGDKATVTVAFNYIGKAGDAPTFQGVRTYKYDLTADKGPTRVGWEGKEGQQAVVMGGKKYTYYPALTDRTENGTLAVTKVDGGKVRLVGVYHYDRVLFVIDETLKPGDPLLLEAAVAKLSEDEAVVAAHMKTLSSTDAKTRSDAAEALRRIVAKYPSGTIYLSSKDGGETAWRAKVDRVEPGMGACEIRCGQNYGSEDRMSPSSRPAAKPMEQRDSFRARRAV